MFNSYNLKTEKLFSKDIKEPQTELLTSLKKQIFNWTSKISKRDLSPNRIIKQGRNKEITVQE